MTAVTFGDLLFTGMGHLDAAAGRWAQEGGDPLVATWQLCRVVDVVGRYVGGTTPWYEALAPERADVVWWQVARNDVALALGRTSRSLSAAQEALGGSRGPVEMPPGLPLAEAARALLAARDLLSTHLEADPDGTWAGRTEWAPVITSAPVFKAVTDLAASCCQHLAPLAEQLAKQLAGQPSGAATELAAAGQWLRQAATSARLARQADPVSAGDRTLLFAIPLAGMAHRARPQQGETTGELCRGIILSAGRLQAMARGAARSASWSPSATSGAWRWTATAGAVTSHLGNGMLVALAGRAGPLALPADSLIAAADALTDAQASWQRLAEAWGLITTETRMLVSAAMTEASDLVIRLGRLARDNPRWTPAAEDDAPPRDPARLVPDADAAAMVLSVVHHAACAFEQVAEADLGAVQAAREARRLYVPVRIMPDTRLPRNHLLTIPRRYVIAPEEKTEPLLVAYQAAADAASRAAQALDQAATAVGAPSRAMALARHASQYELVWDPLPPGRAELGAPNPWAGGPGPMESILMQIGVTDQMLLQRAALVDGAGENLIAEARATAQPPATAAEPSPPGRHVLRAGPDFPVGPAVCVPGARPGGRRSRRPPPAGRAAGPGSSVLTSRPGRGGCGVISPVPGRNGRTRYRRTHQR